MLSYCPTNHLLFGHYLRVRSQNSGVRSQNERTVYQLKAF